VEGKSLHQTHQTLHPAIGMVDRTSEYPSSTFI
jgi:hypothetical protein